MLAYAHLHKRECKQGHEAVTTAPWDQSFFEIVLEFHAFAKLYIHPKYYKNLKKVLTKAIWADKNGLVSGSLAFTSS